MGAGTWALCFIHRGFELRDYAYAVVCDRFAWRCAPEHRGAIRGGAGGGCFILDYIQETPPFPKKKKKDRCGAYVQALSWKRPHSSGMFAWARCLHLKKNIKKISH